MFFTSNFQNGLGHGFSCAGLFQQRTGYCPQGNDQTYVCHRSSHPISKGFQHRFHSHAGNNGKNKGRGNQSKEWMKFQFDSTDYQGQYCKDQSSNHRKSTVHGNSSFTMEKIDLIFSDRCSDILSGYQQAPVVRRWPRQSGWRWPVFRPSVPVSPDTLYSGRKPSNGKVR